MAELPRPSNSRESDLSALLRARGPAVEPALIVWNVVPDWRADLRLEMPRQRFTGAGETPDEAIADALRWAGVESSDG